ncbi:hypothetical protein [Candidatus Williamhamiltonella defendens]|nr:hypothetical protein [Candidatus Hamiltonella defensa]CED78762.1 Conserved hypothetical protein [Candidatus Hamiltonella defensa (Bemisia tabaci)]
MSLFISSNSTKALIAKTDSLEKKFNELGEQKKSKNSSFIRKIKSFRNSSTKAGIRKKLKMKSLKTLEKELGKAEALKVKLRSHCRKLAPKMLKKAEKNKKNGGKDKLEQLQLIDKKNASEKRLIRKIDDDLSKFASIEISKETSETLFNQLNEKNRAYKL